MQQIYQNTAKKTSWGIIFQLHLVVKSEHYFVQLKQYVDYEKENIRVRRRHINFLAEVILIIHL